MGILKELTDEYFEKSIRRENGKYIEIDGCKVIVPSDYDEDKFLHKLGEIISRMIVIFVKDTEIDKFGEYNHIKCGNDYTMAIETYEYFVNITKIPEDFDETMYKSLIKLLKHYMNDINIFKKNDNDYIELVNDEDYVKMRNSSGLDENEFKEHITTIISKFIGDFKETVGLEAKDILNMRKDSNVCIEIRNWGFGMDMTKIRYGGRMIEWWNKEIKKISK